MQKSIVRPDGSLNVMTINEEPSMTQQQFEAECDINNIMARYEKTGQITHLAKKPGVYADLTELGDYQHMLHKVMHAEESFMTLDAKTRLRFQNDPAQLISFLQDEKNYDEGVSLGLLNKKPEPQPIPNELNETKSQAQTKTKQSPSTKKLDEE